MEIWYRATAFCKTWRVITPAIKQIFGYENGTVYSNHQRHARYPLALDSHVSQIVARGRLEAVNVNMGKGGRRELPL